VAKLLKPIGEILIEQGAIENDQLALALEKQKESKNSQRLGEILIEMGIVSEADLVVALTTQYSFAYLPLKYIIPNSDAYSLITKEAAYQYHCIPIDRVKDTLTVVTTDPSDSKALKEIENLTKCKTQVFITTVSEMRTALKQFYGGEQA